MSKWNKLNPAEEMVVAAQMLETTGAPYGDDKLKFIMGHDNGKIEIYGWKDDVLVMSQIHARPEHPEEASRILMGRLKENAGRLEDCEMLK